MNGLVSSYVEEQMDILMEWDEVAIVDALRITTRELLEISEFRNRAEQWIMANCP